MPHTNHFTDRRTHSRVPAATMPLFTSPILNELVSKTHSLNPKTESAPVRAKLTMSDLSTKQIRRNSTRRFFPGIFDLETMKTGKIAQKLGELAVANDIAYVPRLPDDALVGINPDELHSRNSYIQVHHSAMDFTRQLPKGTQPGYYNPNTHTLVPRDDTQPDNTKFPLLAEEKKEVPLDLLDLEFLTNKPTTVVTTQENSMDQTREANSTDSARRPRTELRDMERRQVPFYPLPLTYPQMRDQPGKTTDTSTPVSSQQIPASQIPRPLRSARRQSFQKSNPLKPRGNVSFSEHPELFFSTPPTLQDYPTYDVLRSPRHPILPQLETTIPPQTPPSKYNTSRSRIATQDRHHLYPIAISLPTILPPPATWNAPSPRSDDFDYIPHHPKRNTIIPIPPSRPSTPPLTLDSVQTFSPKLSHIFPPIPSVIKPKTLPINDILTEPNTTTPAPFYSLPAPTTVRSKTVRRNTGIYRKKTSQEIWDDKFADEAQGMREREKEADEREAEKLEEEQRKIKAQALEREAFEKRHREGVAAMERAVEEEKRKEHERRIQRQAQREGGLQAAARTFEMENTRREHILRTRTRDRNINNNITPAPPDGPPRNDDSIMRPTARTFHLDQSQHQIRRTPTLEVQRQRLRERDDRQEEERRWKPNPVARTFELESGFESQFEEVGAARKMWMR